MYLCLLQGGLRFRFCRSRLGQARSASFVVRRSFRAIVLLVAAVVQPTHRAVGAFRGLRVQECLGGEDGGKEKARRFGLAKATGGHDGGGHRSLDQGQIVVVNDE